mgnify:CR=1 FL=1
MDAKMVLLILYQTYSLESYNYFTHVAIAGMAAEWMQRWFVDNDDVCDYKVVNI